MQDFRAALYNENRSLEDLANLYENQFYKHCEKYYKDMAWHSADLVAPFVENDKIFLHLYTELTYRYTHLKHYTKVNLQFRTQSYENYCALFDHILSSDKLKFDLPNSWLCDMIDEFVYQFEGFCHYRMKLKEKKEKSDIEYLKAHQNVWNTATVLNYLEQFVAKSN